MRKLVVSAISCGIFWTIQHCGHSMLIAAEAAQANLKRGSPQSQGMDSGVLAEALDFVRTNRIPLHSMLIVRNQVLVLEAYFWPYLGREIHDVASVTKSFTSTAVGIAVDQGKLRGVDGQVYQLRKIAEPDARKRDLRVRHLLTMTSGLDCDTEGGEKALAAMRASENWAAYAFALPMVSDPGSSYAYCSCNNHLLSSIITTSTGMSTSRYLQANLFGPLGIKDVIWPQDPQGLTHGWGDLHMHPRDMVKVGLLFLNQGTWGDRQILSKEWIRDATRSNVDVRPGVGYGYSWWINTARPPIFEAVGRGGQRISILPKENIVAVFTGGGANTDDIAPFLFRAIRSDNALPESRGATEQLRHALAQSLTEIREIPSTLTPKLAENASDVSLSLSRNPLGLRSLRLDFKNRREATATLSFDDSNWKTPVGLDGRRRLHPGGPHGLTLASVGRWLSEDEFLLDIDTVANVNHFIFRVRFDGERVLIRMDELTGEMKDVVVSAKIGRKSRANRIAVQP